MLTDSSSRFRFLSSCAEPGLNTGEAAERGTGVPNNDASSLQIVMGFGGGAGAAAGVEDGTDAGAGGGCTAGV